MNAVLAPVEETTEDEEVTEVRQPNLFAMFPDLIPMFKSLTIGGVPIFDEFGNVKD